MSYVFCLMSFTVFLSNIFFVLFCVLSCFHPMSFALFLSCCIFYDVFGVFFFCIFYIAFVILCLFCLVMSFMLFLPFLHHYITLVFLRLLNCFSLVMSFSFRLCCLPINPFCLISFKLFSLSFLSSYNVFVVFLVKSFTSF